MTKVGDSAVTLLDDTFAGGVDRVVALMRHSAREFAPGVNDLHNPLTDEGREYAVSLGARIPEGLTLRGYASPPERCMETAELVLAGYRRHGGNTTRHRPVEGLGVFYVLDQMKMWRAMSEAGGQVPFLQRWFRGDAPDDAMMPFDLAARLVLRVLVEKLKQPIAARQLDLCVSHDMTLYLLRHALLGLDIEAEEVAFLDALVAFEKGGELWLACHGREPKRVSAEL